MIDWDLPVVETVMLAAMHLVGCSWPEAARDAASRRVQLALHDGTIL
jgi:hypothetical protein